MEFREPSPPEADIQRLERVGFSPEQIAGLFRVKAHYQRETSHRSNSEYRRQVFVRWLYLQGRLQS